MSTGPDINTPKVVICPYCGEAQPAADFCRECRGAFEPLSRQATHNAMGPWFVHDHQHPHRPGCSYETLATMIERGQVTRYTIVRGPTSKQFWTVARHVPGVSHLIGYCHECDASVETTATGCLACGALFGAYLDRNHLGLPEVRPLPGEVPDVATDPGYVARDSTMAPPVWRSVSSFAADEELLAPVRSSSPVETPGDASDAAPDRQGVDPLQTSVVRAMQRRIARQQRTIRLLVGLVFAVAVMGAAFNLMTALRDRPAPPHERAVPPVAADAGVTAEPGAASGEDRPDDAPGEGSLVEGDPSDASGPVETADGDTVSPVLPPDALALGAAERQRADQLARSAADSSRPVADRIADYETALDVLRTLAGTGADPAEIEAEIARLEDRLERLRLGEFFK